MTEAKTRETDKLISAAMFKRRIIDVMFDDYAKAGHEDGFNALRTVMRLLDEQPEADAKKSRLTIVIVEEV